MGIKSEYIIILGKILAWIFGIAVIFMLLLKLTSHSPTTDEIIVALLSSILVTIMTFGYIIGLHIGDVKRFMKESDRRFLALVEDYKCQKLSTSL